MNPDLNVAGWNSVIWFASFLTALCLARSLYYRLQLKKVSGFAPTVRVILTRPELRITAGFILVCAAVMERSMARFVLHAIRYEGDYAAVTHYLGYADFWDFPAAALFVTGMLLVMWEGFVAKSPKPFYVLLGLSATMLVVFTLGVTVAKHAGCTLLYQIFDLRGCD